VKVGISLWRLINKIGRIAIDTALIPPKEIIDIVTDISKEPMKKAKHII